MKAVGLTYIKGETVTVVKEVSEIPGTPTL